MTRTFRRCSDSQIVRKRSRKSYATPQGARRGARGAGARASRRRAQSHEIQGNSEPPNKRELFLDRLRRSWHSQLQWENRRRRRWGCGEPLRLSPTHPAPSPLGPERAPALASPGPHVRSRSLPAARQGRPRPAPHFRRRDSRDARSRRRDFRLCVEPALFRAMVGRERWRRAAASHSARFAPCTDPSRLAS